MTATGCRRLGATAILAIVVAACGGSTPAPPAVDLLPVDRSKGVFCGDRLRWGIQLAPGGKLRLELPAVSTGEVRIVACSTDQRARPLPNELAVTFEGGGVASRREPVGAWTELAVAVPREAGAVVLEVLGSTPVLVDEVVWQADGGLVSSKSRDRRRARGIVMVSVDTLRADALGAYGGPATPALDRLAMEGELHLRHYAASSWTKPSHASLLTGQPPEVHGANDAEAAIHPEVLTLAERFRAAGWRTGGLVRHVWLGEKFGFARGFDTWEVVDWDAGEQARAAVRWIDANAEAPDAQPFFYFLHLMTAHSDFHHLPYEGPGVDRHWVRQRWGIGNYGCRQGRCASSLLEVLEVGRVEPLAEDPEILRALYQSGVAEVDQVLGEMVEALRRLGWLDHITLVITSDHGEELLDHGFAMHRDWWEPVLRVPLLVRRPGVAPRVVEEKSSSIDLVADLAEEGGLDREGLAGVPIAGRRTQRPVFAGVEWSVSWLGPLKLVERPGLPPLLFDLAVDPNERHDLAEASPERVAQLAALRTRWEASLARPLGAGVRAPLDAEEAAALRALGYLGSRE